MIRYTENLYLGKTASDMKEKVVHTIARGGTMPGLYLITIASNGVDQLDILSSVFLRQERTRENLPLVVGAAIGRIESFHVVRKMIEDAWRATGSADAKSYLLERAQGRIIEGTFRETEGQEDR